MPQSSPRGRVHGVLRIACLGPPALELTRSDRRLTERDRAERAPALSFGHYDRSLEHRLDVAVVRGPRPVALTTAVGGVCSGYMLKTG